MNTSTDLVLVSFIQDHAEGGSFYKSRNHGWPFHVTIVPWFGTNDFQKLDNLLLDTAAKIAPIAIQVGPIVNFGKVKDIPVNVLQNQELLTAIHRSLLKNILKQGHLLDDSWVNDNYSAHITRHLDAATNHEQGESLVLDHLYLVKMISDDHCVFLKKYPFGQAK